MMYMFYMEMVLYFRKSPLFYHGRYYNTVQGINLLKIILKALLLPPPHNNTAMSS